MVPWNKDLFLQNPKRRLIFSVLNESNSVEPEDRCSVRVDTDDECDAQFCTKIQMLSLQHVIYCDNARKPG